MEVFLISTAVLAAFLLLLRFVAPPLKVRFRIEDRISTQALLNRVAFLAKSCEVTESGFGISTRSVKRAIKRNIKFLEIYAVSDRYLIPADTSQLLSAVYERYRGVARLCLKQGHVGRYPRLFLLCDTVVKNTRGCITPELMSKVISEFSQLTADEKNELYDVLTFCLAALICTALEDYKKRRHDCEAGISDAGARRVDLDRLNNIDYINGQCAAVSEEGKRELFVLAENNGIDIDAAVKSSNIHAAETAEILTSATAAIKFTLSRTDGKSAKRELSHHVSSATARALQISAIVVTVLTVAISAVFADSVFVAPIIVATGILYTAYVSVLNIFGITYGLLPPIGDKYIAAMQGAIIIFGAIFFNPVIVVFSAAPVLCSVWVSLFFAGESGTLSPLKEIPKSVKNFVAVPRRIIRLNNGIAATVLQSAYGVAVIILSAFFSRAVIMYVIGALALFEPIFDSVTALFVAFGSKLQNKYAVRRESIKDIPQRHYSNIALSRKEDGKLGILRRGRSYELNYVVDCGAGALSLSKSNGISLPQKEVYYAQSNNLEIAAEMIAPPTHDCLAMRFFLVNRTPNEIAVGLSVTCASEISDEFMALYIDDDATDADKRNVLSVNKSKSLGAFERSSFISVLAFGRMAEHVVGVIASDGYFDAGEAAALCCQSSLEKQSGRDLVAISAPPRKNILYTENINVDVSDFGVIGGTFPRAYIILRGDNAQSEWSPTVYPRGYNNRVLHYNGFSRFISEYIGVKCTLDMFAVGEIDALAYRLNIVNTTDIDVDINVSLVCETQSKDKIGIAHISHGAIVTTKDGDGFFISSTEKIERPLDSDIGKNPSVCIGMHIGHGEERTVGFFLSRDILSLENIDIEDCFDNAVSHCNKIPVRPRTTDKMLDYAFFRAFYRIVCEFDRIESDVTLLMLCCAYKYIDADRTATCIKDICAEIKNLPAAHCLLLPLVIDDYLNCTDKSDILSNGEVVKSISWALNSAYKYVLANSDNDSANIAAFYYCAERFRDYITPQQRYRFSNIKCYHRMSRLSLILGVYGNAKLYNVARLYDSGDFDGSYGALSSLIDDAIDFDGNITNAVAYYLLVTEKLFGIDKRGENYWITPAVTLGTPHIEFVLSENNMRTHIVVADNGLTSGSWFTKVGSIVYATNAVTVADYPSPVILFRR
ncbi:MAG: hypothetical protein J1G04_00985 [Clostridiales bacterium]|nr:hypothetical protein [Clostridiales bacterium]